MQIKKYYDSYDKIVKVKKNKVEDIDDNKICDITITKTIIYKKPNIYKAQIMGLKVHINIIN
jgi:hypothetical protein